MKKFLAIIAILLLLPVLFHFSYLFDGAVFFFKAPETYPTAKQNTIYTKERILLVPLDSRPPCLAFVQALANLADREAVSPPKDILDNYTTPAQVLKIHDWLLANIQNADAAIISIDMLLHGGLIASRNPQNSEVLQTKVFRTLNLAAQGKKPLYTFSTIPRLLIPEADATKLWQYHVMVYATKKDMEATFNNPHDFGRMQEMLDRVPLELIQTFSRLYEKNDAFNLQLCELATKNNLTKLVFGQDDGQPFGRPNQSRQTIEKYLHKNNLETDISLSHGADEIALSLLAAHVNNQAGEKPQVFVVYANKEVPDLVMPFMSSTLFETVEEKIASVGAVVTEDKQAADLVLFIHAGTNNITKQELTQTVHRVAALAKEKPLALVDLSYNFRKREALADTFLQENIPFSCLAAYAGWNTAGNSIGTALAQGTIFCTQLKRTEPEQHMALYQKNFTFTISRLLDDWSYQKEVQSATNSFLKWQNINPYKLGLQKEYTQKKIAYSLFRRQKSLFYKNIGLHPFYQDKNHAYYITELDAAVTLPWERTFEIDVKVTVDIGQSKLP